MADKMSFSFRPFLWAAWLTLAYVAIFGAPGWLVPFDDSDVPPKRSGMKLHRDALTGCEYLSKPFGGLMPRVDAAGKHICRAAPGESS